MRSYAEQCGVMRSNVELCGAMLSDTGQSEVNRIEFSDTEPKILTIGTKVLYQLTSIFIY